MYLLDTDHMTILERGGTAALRLTMRLSELPDSQIATTIISYEEQCKGWLARTSTARDEALIRAYRQFQYHLEIYGGMQVCSYDDAAHEWFRTLQSRRVRIGTQDLKIAAIALSLNSTVLTCNTQHFERVPGLKFEDWSI